jgi:hypothetical protein
VGLKTLRVDDVWVDRMIALADGPWRQDRLESLLVRYGWAQPDPDGGARVTWQPGEPHWLGEGRGQPIGKYLLLGDPPGNGGADEFVSLQCALFWPPLDGVLDDGFTDEDADEDDLDGDYGPDWIRRPDAVAADFLAEYARLRELVRQRLGEPARVIADEPGTRLEVWRLDGTSIVLRRGDDVTSYSHYDEIAVIAYGSGDEAGWR